MRNFINSKDIIDYQYLLNDINKHKNNSTDLSFVGKNKVLGLLFFNPSLRTRLSTQSTFNVFSYGKLILEIVKFLILHQVILGNFI